MKYILITGGVISGIGKGIVASSIGAILIACNLKVTAIKIDPYHNIDAGTFSPYEHGEVYVLNDGCEVDLDLGNYERFLDVELKSTNNITTGKISKRAWEQERRGDYLGKTVRTIPHFTDVIKHWILEAATEKDVDICIIELGGTIGDIESMVFTKALSQLKTNVKKDNFCICHVTPIISVGPHREHKTRAAQVSVEDSKTAGVFPDIIVARSDRAISESIRDKFSLCDLKMERIFNLPDLETIYKVPIELEKQGIVAAISECLNIKSLTCDNLKRWEDISNIAINAKRIISVALVGKYTALADCYTSVVKSIEHACYHVGAKPKITYIESNLLENLGTENQAWKDLESCQCLIVPGGFGVRGVEGKINAIKWAREKKIPFLGICLGFQMAVVEYARNIMGIANAHSAEFDDKVPTGIEPLVIEMLEYLDPEKKMGGTMRLGLRETKFVTDKSILKELYGNKDVIEERHRHRYEINPDHIEKLEKAGLRFVGKNSDETRMEILELDYEVHPYFVAVQYHPEYLSRPFRPSPPFLGLIKATEIK